MQPDLPEPVVPAISRCGIRARSVHDRVPGDVLARARPSSGLAVAGQVVEDVAQRDEFGEWFGTSTPTACLPGIGARMRISVVASA